MKKIKYALASILMLSASLSYASVILQGTRVIYPSNSKDVTIVAENTGQQPALVQAWLDAGEDLKTLDDDETPFVLTPPIFRLNPDKTQTIKIIYNKDPMPKDRESLFWLNVLEVPPTLADESNQNSLRVNFRTRVKVFFRPAELSGDVRKAASEVKWGLSQIGKDVNVAVTNPTPYYITLTKVSADVAGKTYQGNGQMVAPFSSAEVILNGLKSTVGLSKVTYSFIDDKGAVITMESKQ